MEESLNLAVKPFDVTTMDIYCRRHTVFGTFGDLVAATDYQPTFEISRSVEILRLANAYDAYMILRGDWRRAWRISL